VFALDQEYTSNKAHKPKPNHPWKNSVKADVAAWAREESQLMPLKTVRVAKIETVAKHDRRNFVEKQI